MQINEENMDGILSNLNLLKMSGNPWTCDGNNIFNFIRHFSQKVL